tara:strand:+ start:1081 stop:1578 length:498 start_codon:yes stop_codon:yes gene_type:complete
MWTILKADNKNLNILKEDLRKKLGPSFSIYCPRFSIEKFKNNKLVNKKYNLLGDYFFCYHENFNNPHIINKLKFCRGLKYFLSGFLSSQDEISTFIKKCKNSESKDGYIKQNFIKIIINAKYKFSSGPFSEMIFKVINLHKNKLRILLGENETIVLKDKFLFNKI